MLGLMFAVMLVGAGFLVSKRKGRSGQESTQALESRLVLQEGLNTSTNATKVEFMERSIAGTEERVVVSADLVYGSILVQSGFDNATLYP
jgi:hypothetical protein